MRFLILIFIFTKSFFIYASTLDNKDLLNDPNSNMPKENTGFWEGEWYFSWGYNRDYWRPSDIHISQKSLGNDFTIHNVRAEDFPQWNSGVFNKELTEPQFNVRIGHFIDKDRTWALELNYDHTKYSTFIDQYARVSGTIGGNYVDSTQLLTYDYFHYNLHNGANHFMLNMVKRIPILFETNENFSLAGVIKAGTGIMVPHSENKVLGNTNYVGSKEWGNLIGMKNGWWQLNGWTVGVEAGLRFVIWNPIYIEFTDKEAYASLVNIPVYQGVADQVLWMNELILSLGYTFDTLKKD